MTEPARSGIISVPPNRKVRSNPLDQTRPWLPHPMTLLEWRVGYVEAKPDKMLIYVQTRYGVFGLDLSIEQAEELGELILLRAKQATWAKQKTERVSQPEKRGLLESASS